MNLKNLSILSAGLLIFATTTFADVVGDINNVASKFKSINDSSMKAYYSSNSYRTMLYKMQIDTRKALKDETSLKNQYEKSMCDLKVLTEDLKNFKEVFNTHKNTFETANKQLDNIIKCFPIGDLRFKQIESILLKTKEMIAENPGDKYQDRNYFYAIESRYNSAKNVLANLQNTSRNLALSANISKPRMGGICSTSDMIKSYVEKSEKSLSKSDRDIEDLSTKTKDFSSLFADSLENFSDIIKSHSKAQEISLKSSFEFNKLLLNDLPKSKYADEIFYQDFSVKISSISRLNLDLNNIELKSKSLMEGRLSSSLANKDDGFGGSRDYAAPAGFKSESKANKLNANNVRDEILQNCNMIDSVTRQINSISDSIRDINSTLESNIFAIENDERLISNLLNSSIAIFSNSQKISSSALILSIYLDTLAAQNDISKSQLEKLYDDINKEFENITSIAKSIISDSEKITESL